MYRQGNLLIMKTGEIPKGAKRVVSGIVLRGGNVFEKGGVMYLEVAKAARLVHEEHKTIKLSGGKYAVKRQREYQSKDMTRLVVD